MTDNLNPAHVAWSRQMFDNLRDGGVWGIPRSGLMFRKAGKRFELYERMPHDPAMPITADQVREQQDSEFDAVKRHFEAAGATVVDVTKGDSNA